MGAVLEEALAMKSKLKVMARKATSKNPLEGYDAEDLLQGLYTKVLDKEDSYNPEKSKKNTWIYTVFQNYIRNLFRKQERSKVRYYAVEESEKIVSPLLSEADAQYPQRIEQIERRMDLRSATKSLLSWLKEHDFDAYKVLNAMLKNKANYYNASIEADMSVREINSIITRIRKYDLTKRLLTL